MSDADLVKFANVAGADEVFAPEFTSIVAGLHAAFGGRIRDARGRRAEVLDAALDRGRMPGAPGQGDGRGEWRVPPVPDELRKPGIEISGPASITPMFINALNPGPDGTRAEGYLDDDEDSGGHRLIDTVRAAINRVEGLEGSLTYTDEARGRTYSVQDGELPFFMHRERGLALDEPDFTVDGEPVSAALLGTALTLFHAGRAHARQGRGIYFYLPKLEDAREASLYRELFDACRERMPHLRDVNIRAIILVESLPAVWQMDSMLRELGPYAAGLNAARWDLKASILEYAMTDPRSVWPDRFDVDVKSTPFIADIFRRLVAICLRRDAVPIGGMATALPSRDEEINRRAGEAIRADKEWEARQGFLRGWVAHIHHMMTAATPFKELRSGKWRPSVEMGDPEYYPLRVERPDGEITAEGTRRNVRTLIEYLEGWLRGRGAKGIDSLAGRPGVHPSLMEDLATARISVAQTAQRIIHSAVAEDTGEAHDQALVARILRSECEDIVARLDSRHDTGVRERYRNATRIALHWIRSYTKLDFRSLGSYTRRQLDEIAADADVS